MWTCRRPKHCLFGPWAGSACEDELGSWEEEGAKGIPNPKELSGSNSESQARCFVRGGGSSAIRPVKSRRPRQPGVFGSQESPSNCAAKKTAC